MSKKKAQNIEGLHEEFHYNIDFKTQVLPQNWIWVKMYNTCDFIDYRGKTPRKTTSGVRLITAKNVRMNRVNLEPLEFIAEEEYSNWMTRGIPKQGDILITTEAPLGNVALLDTSEKVALAQRIITLVPNETIDKYYLKFILQSPQIQSVLISNSTGTTVSGIKASKLKEIKIPLPPLDEQSRIANKIKMLLERIDEAKQLIEEAKETFKLRREAILDSVFNFRGNVNTKKVRVNSQIELNVPDIWNVGTIGNSTKNYNNSRIPVSLTERKKMKGDIPYYGATGVVDYVEGFTHEGEFVCLGEDGANLLSRSKPQAYMIYGRAWVNNHAHVLSGGDKILNEYLLYYLNFIPLNDFITGTAQPKLNRTKLDSITIVYPSKDEQKKIAKKISLCFEKEFEVLNIISNVEIKLSSIKKAVLGKAFKGELGTNNSNEESVIELMKSVLQGKLS